MTFRTIACSLALLVGLSAKDVPDPDPTRFAKAISAFDARDEKNPPNPGGTVFVGSSSIRLLNISTYFPEVDGLNRGFGGSHISDLNHYLDRVLLRYKPSTVVFYCGSNDLWGSKSVGQVEEDFNEFTRRLFEVSPKAKLIVIPVRPCPARHSIRATEDAMNARFAEIASKDERQVFLPELVKAYLLPDGAPNPKFFVKDMLHMNDAGYQEWQRVIQPHLK